MIKFEKCDLESLARYQHEIWMKKRKKEGWKYGKKSDFDKLICLAITGWNNLNDDTKKAIERYIELWPEALIRSNLKIEK
ncbi:RyR domain-containing protein [Terrisporobacter sp.]